MATCGGERDSRREARMVSSEILMHENFMGLGIDVTNVSLGGPEGADDDPQRPFSAEESRQLALRLEEISARRRAMEEGRVIKVKVGKKPAPEDEEEQEQEERTLAMKKKPYVTDYAAWERFEARTKVVEVESNPPVRPGVDVDAYGYKEVEVSAEEAEKLRREERARIEAGALREAGNAAFQQGRMDEAMALYQKGLDMCPDSAALHANAAAVHLKAGRFSDAVDASRNARRLAKDGEADPAFRLKVAARLATALSHREEDETEMATALAEAHEIAESLIKTKQARDDAARVRAECDARVQGRREKVDAVAALDAAPDTVVEKMRRAEHLCARVLLDANEKESAVRAALRELVELARLSPYVVDALRRAGLASRLHSEVASADETSAVELLAELLTAPGVGAHYFRAAAVREFSSAEVAVGECVALLPDSRRKKCAAAAAKCLAAADPAKVGPALLRHTLQDAEKPDETFLHLYLEATVEGSKDLLLPRLHLLAHVLRESKAFLEALVAKGSKDLALDLAAGVARALVLKDRADRLEALRLMQEVLTGRPSLKRALACLDTVHALGTGLYQELRSLTQKKETSTESSVPVEVTVDLGGLPLESREVVALNLHCVADIASGRPEVIHALLQDEDALPGMLVALLDDPHVTCSLTYPALRVVSAATQLDWNDLDASLCMLGAGEALLALVERESTTPTCPEGETVRQLALSTLGTLATSGPFIERVRRQASKCEDPAATPAIRALVCAWPRGDLHSEKALPEEVLYGLATAMGVLVTHVPSLCASFVEGGPHPWFFADCVGKWYAAGTRPVAKLLEHIMAQLMGEQKEGVWATVERLEPETREKFIREWVSRLAAEDPAQLVQGLQNPGA